MNSVSSCEYPKGYDNYLSFLQTKNSEKQTSSCELSQRKMSENILKMCGYKVSATERFFEWMRRDKICRQGRVRRQYFMYCQVL